MPDSAQPHPEQPRTPRIMIKTIGVIGAGQMGNGIAHVAALNGLDVTIVDIGNALGAFIQLKIDAAGPAAGQIQVFSRITVRRAAGAGPPLTDVIGPS